MSLLTIKAISKNSIYRNFLKCRSFSGIDFPRSRASLEEKKKNLKTTIDKDKELTDYVSHVYKQTTMNLGVTVGSSIATLGTGALLMNPLSSMGIDPVVPFCGAVFSGFGLALYNAWNLGIADFVDGKMVNEEERKKRVNLLHIGMGMTIAPSLLVFHQAIPYAAIGTGILVSGPIVASMYLPKGKLLAFGPAMYTSLLGLVGVSIGGIFFPILHNVNVYGGLVLFTMYSAYDTHKMIDDYENGNKDYLGHSTDYSLNAINIFIRLLEIIGKAQKK